MVKFKCIHSGNIVSFEADHDIKTMREHPEYEEVTEEEKTEEKPKRKAKGE